MSIRRYVSTITLLALVIALGFAATTGHLHGLDIALSRQLNLQSSVSPDWLILLMQTISWTGGGTQRYIMVAVFAGLLGKWRGWPVGIGLIIASLLSSFASDILKVAFARPRPSLVPHLDIVNNLSYPSGHATNAMVVYLFVALMVPTHHRILWMIPMLLLAFVTGLSRIMLGVHYPSDVIGGWMLGAAFAIAAAEITKRKQGAV